MSIAQPAAGLCATHPLVPANWACQRCGTFVCTECERRTRPEAAPLCPACWSLRDKALETTAKSSSRQVAIAGLVLGALSFLHPLAMIGSAILNLRGLRQPKQGSPHRWMNVTGIVLTLCAVLVWAIGITLIALSSPS